MPITQQVNEDEAYRELIHNNVTQFHKNFNERQWERNGDLVRDDILVIANGQQSLGRAAFVKNIQRFVIPFPDIAIEDVDVVVGGNKAAIRFVVTGTHLGDLETPAGVLPATHRKITVDGIEFFEFDAKGLLAHLVTVEDIAGLMKQLTS